MPKIAYISKRFSASSQEIIDQANKIIAEYQSQGFTLTLRQLFYQHVSRGLLPNTQQSYRRLGSIISDARRTGLVDWSAIEDRTRFIRENSHWNHPGEILESAANSFALDMWANQMYRPEVYIEKDALTGVIEPVCTELDVPYLSCRGYPSDSMVWRAARKIRLHWQNGQHTKVLHLGDHDPSGLDMTEDIKKRLALFTRNEDSFEVNRLALNIDQIEEYGPPPNPARFSDPRATWYIEQYGEQSWELDALEPTVLSNLVREEVCNVLRDQDAWDSKKDTEDGYREILTELADDPRWNE